MTINKAWLCVCSVWGAAVGTILYFTDDSIAAGFVWLTVGIIIGFLDGFFLERFVETIFRGTGGWPPDPLHPLDILPIVVLFPGTFFGPLVGAWIYSCCMGSAWPGALLGLAFGPTFFSLVCFIPFCLILVKPLPKVILTGKPLQMKVVIPTTEEKRSNSLWMDMFWIIGICLALPLIVVVVLIRCVAWFPRHRKRLRVFARLRECGGVFGADPEMDRFYGVRLENPAIGDAEVESLRVFPEMDHVSLSHTRVTDAGLSHLQNMRELKIIELAGTAITNSGLKHLSGLMSLGCLDLSRTKVGDEGLEYLLGLRNLKFLHLEETQVTQTGVERLLMILPDLEVQR
jgi:Leucine Rich repeat